MKHHIRIAAAVVAAVMLLASCGGGDSSGRTKNSALCYETQDDKDAAVKAAQDAFDATMGGGAPGDSISDTTVPETEDSVVETEDSVVDEAPSDTVLMESSPADGGGYRRPAVRAASGEFTPDQQQAQMDLEAAENQPLCEGEDVAIAEKTCEVTLTRVIEWSGSSNCEEVVIGFVDSRSTAAVEWQASVGSQVVASGTWDSDSEPTKVLTFVYGSEISAESGSDGEITTVTCMGTVSGTSGDVAMTDDCPDGFVYSSLSADGMIWVLNKDGNEMGADGAVLASGPLDISGLTPETPVTFKISYDVASEGDSSDTTVAGEDDSPCSMTLTSTGISWSCSDESLFNVAIEDMSNRDVYPLIECASEGSFTVAENQQFWFNFYLINGDQTFLNGFNNDRPQNEPIGFTVPEDTEGVCVEEDDSDFSEWDELPLSGQSDMQTEQYSFTVPEEFDGPVLVKFESTDDFDVDMDDHSGFEWYSCEDDECPPYIGYSMWDLAAGEYFIEIEDNVEVVTWTSNIEIVANPIEFPKLPYSYTSDGSETTYKLTLTETETVQLTATAGQTCAVAEDDEEENGFVDPEIDIYGPYGVEEDDDNSGRGDGNCSASLLEIELEPGTYVVSVEDGDNEGGSITLGSSVELTEFKSITWDLVSTSASPDTTFEIVVPAGGAWFRANTVINETVTAVYDVTDPEDSEFLSEEGCSNADGDIETDDDECPDSFLVLLDSNDDEVVTDDDGGEQYSESTSNGIRTEVWTNYYASQFSVYLEEGIYTLVVMDCCGPWRKDEPSTDVYEVRFGFGSLVATEIPKVEIVADESPTIPASVEQVKLPDAQLSVDGSVSTSISDGVNTMVCDTSCIDAMFTNAGIADGTITISAGGESVTMRKGQKKAMIPIGKNADAINATVVSTDGSQTVSLSSKISQIPASVQSVIDSKTASGSTGSGSSMNWLLIAALGLIVVAGAGVAVSRKKKSA